MVYTTRLRPQTKKTVLTMSLACLIMLILSACNGDPQLQRSSDQNKSDLDKAISQAQNLGISPALLQPIIEQEKSLSQTGAPLSLFSAQPTDNYNSNLSQRYKILLVQVQGLQKQTTQQAAYQASVDLQSFENILGVQQARGFIETKPFADQLAHDQSLMIQGQSPKIFLQVSNNAKDGTLALHLLGSTYDKYQSLNNIIQQLQTSRLDTTALEQQAQNDLQLFRAASSSADFTNLDHQLDAQLQNTITFSTQAIPFIGANKLQQFSDAIATMKAAGVDVTPYQQRLDSDQSALNNAKTLNDYLTFSSKVDADVASTKLPTLQATAKTQIQQFHQEVTNWGNQHQYTDPFNGQTYRLGYEYAANGIGSDPDDAFQAAQTADDYQAVIDLTVNDMFNLKAMETDSSDSTPANQPHATDTQLLEHYKVTTGQVIVVSLAEESLRLYQNGSFVKYFPITSGQYDKPSLPGFWHTIDRESPTKFVSGAAPGSALWYPDTKINYAIGYHSDGYFLHDSWWRLDYGPHTNFPHVDSGGNQSFAGTGSHGCINMPEAMAAWLYQNTTYNTTTIIY